jgi:hypothetical protein
VRDEHIVEAVNVRYEEFVSTSIVSVRIVLSMDMVPQCSAMERLTSSPYVLDIYSFCGGTGIFEFASGGDIDNAILGGSKRRKKDKLSSLEKLYIGTYSHIHLHCRVWQDWSCVGNRT